MVVIAAHILLEGFIRHDDVLATSVASSAVAVEDGLTGARISSEDRSRREASRERRRDHGGRHLRAGRRLEWELEGSGRAEHGGHRAERHR